MKYLYKTKHIIYNKIYHTIQWLERTTFVVDLSISHMGNTQLFRMTFVKSV